MYIYVYVYIYIHIYIYTYKFAQNQIKIISSMLPWRSPMNRTNQRTQDESQWIVA